MPPPICADWRHKVFYQSVRSFVWSCEHDVLQTNKPISLQIGKNGQEHEMVKFGVEVRGQANERSKIHLETWRRHHCRSVVSTGYSSCDFIAVRKWSYLLTYLRTLMMPSDWLTCDVWCDVILWHSATLERDLTDWLDIFIIVNYKICRRLLIYTSLFVIIW